VNPIKTKKLTNIRAAGKDDAILLTPPIQLTLEYAVEFIADDELVEVTPTSIPFANAFSKKRTASAPRAATGPKELPDEGESLTMSRARVHAASASSAAYCRLRADRKRRCHDLQRISIDG